MTAAPAAWPSLTAEGWPDTYATLHMWTQVVGKVRLARSPYVNHWWGVALYVTARGLTTSPIPGRDDTFEITFDFVDHQLLIDTSRGGRRSLPLVAQSVADFYHAVMQALADLGIDVHIWPMPVEVPSPIRFTEDRVHAAYDAAAATAWWQALVAVDSVLKEFRGEFIGKSSPVHFWWGAFDLAVTRFSGRRAPERPGADAIMREGYSHEVMSAEGNDDGHAESEEREQEVGHDDQRVQLDEHRDPPEDALQEHGDRKRPGRDEKPARQLLDAGSSDSGRQGDQSDDEPDAAVPVLDERVEVLLRQERRAAARPVVAAEPRPRETNGRARYDDEEEGCECGVGKERKRLRGDREAGPCRLRRVGFHQARARPVPSTTLPTRASTRPASANEASNTALLS